MECLSHTLGFSYKKLLQHWLKYAVKMLYETAAGAVMYTELQQLRAQGIKEEGDAARWFMHAFTSA